MAVTSFSDLKKYAEGTEVSLPGFGKGQPLVARLKRVSLMTLVREGKVPNKLYSAVSKIFNLNDKKELQLTIESLKENVELMEILAKDSLIEPTYEQIQEAGLKLTDDQLLAIFNFSQNGVTELENFRTEQKDNVSAEYGQGVQQKTE